MYSRLQNIVESQSAFLFGPRGTGKTSWVKETFPQAMYLDLLDAATYKSLLANPGLIEELIPNRYKEYVIIDEVQRVPELLNEVHRLIESRGIKFLLTGSSARKLRGRGVNLLAGRALLNYMHPLTAKEMGADFELKRAIKTGMLPGAQSDVSEQYLHSYAQVYLEQEVQQEGLVRRLDDFARFLGVASLLQGQVVNMQNIAREAMVSRATVVGYFRILEELLIGHMLPAFTKRAKRRLVASPKFYYFDSGVYQILRPRGPYDANDEVGGVALETLVYQQIKALNDLLNWKYELYYFRTASGIEVDFVMYGERGIAGIEVKLASQVTPRMVRNLENFSRDYPDAKLYLLYTGKIKQYIGNVTVIPVTEFFMEMDKWV